MKSKIKKRNNNISNRFTIMIVPNSSKKVIKLSFSRLTSNLLVSFFFILCLSLCGSICFSLYQQKKITYYANKVEEQQNEISMLMEKNENYLAELTSLQDKTKEVMNQLDALSNFRNMIYEKVNKSTNNTMQTNLNEIEYYEYSSTQASNKIITYQGGGESYDFDEIAKNLNRTVDSSKNIVDIEYKKLQDLDSFIEEITPYLEAYPSILPTKGKLTSTMGWRRNPFNSSRGEFHSGIDIAVNVGTDVVATGNGTVIFSAYKRGYGYLVIIDHGFGIHTYYAHNSSLLVEEGDIVNRGDIIAKSGSTGYSTGPHVHYEIRLNNVPQDPLTYIIKN
ncbi:MAG: M23 family metallopeptidase [Epulopiscium sp.]|nr:M23 family metallopeptidase [Candidatus Epulonipiscium sp.]